MKMDMKEYTYIYIYIYIYSYATSIFLASHTPILVHHNIQQEAVTQRSSGSKDAPLTDVNKVQPTLCFNVPCVVIQLWNINQQNALFQINVLIQFFLSPKCLEQIMFVIRKTICSFICYVFHAEITIIVIVIILISEWKTYHIKLHLQYSFFWWWT
jgi:hypothetical protein